MYPDFPSPGLSPEAQKIIQVVESIKFAEKYRSLSNKEKKSIVLLNKNHKNKYISELCKEKILNGVC